jgi:hypothetical protein
VSNLNYIVWGRYEYLEKLLQEYLGPAHCTVWPRRLIGPSPPVKCLHRVCTQASPKLTAPLRDRVAVGQWSLRRHPVRPRRTHVCHPPPIIIPCTSWTARPNTLSPPHKGSHHVLALLCSFARSCAFAAAAPMSHRHCSASSRLDHSPHAPKVPHQE